MSSTRLLTLSNLVVEPGTVDEVADRIVERAAAGIGSRLVLPVNAQVFVLGTQNPAFANVLLSAPEVVADGASVTFAMWMLRSGNARRIAGVDLMLALCARAARSGSRVMLIGGREGSAQITAAILKARYPGSQIATCCPPFGFEREPAQLKEVVDQVAAYRPDMAMVALGAPKQELFMDQHLKPLGVPILMAVGGSFEMVSGMVQRAPLWIQNCGMEWAFRLVLEPRRLFKRYLFTNIAFLYLLFIETLLRPLGRKQPAR